MASKMSRVSPFRPGHNVETKQIILNATIPCRHSDNIARGGTRPGKKVSHHSLFDGGDIVGCMERLPVEAGRRTLHVRFAILAKRAVVKFHRQPNFLNENQI